MYSILCTYHTNGNILEIIMMLSKYSKSRSKLKLNKPTKQGCQNQGTFLCIWMFVSVCVYVCMFFPSGFLCCKPTVLFIDSSLSSYWGKNFFCK